MSDSFVIQWTIACQAPLFMEFSQAGILDLVASNPLLQGFFLTQGSNPSLLRLLHCRQILYRGASGKAPVMEAFF